MARKSSLALIVVLGLLLVLFISSSMTYHQQTVVPLMEKLLKNQPFYHEVAKIDFWYGPDHVSVGTSGYFKVLEFLLRKLAHISIYFLLGWGAYSAFSKKFVASGWAWLFIALAVGGIAGIDEFHQLITSDRTPMIQDVMLDSMAGLVGVSLGWLISKNKN